jgi:NADH-quinone oxidoreductase subunit G
VALGTNDIDFRARPNSAEELAFLGAVVAGTLPLSYADLEQPGTVLLVGFEPEEESPIVFLRLRKGTRSGKTKVHSIAAVSSLGLGKLDGRLIPTVPGREADALTNLDLSVRDALNGGIILVGERLASAPGALSAAAGLAEATGARLAWVPRRAGERGAVDAGALPTLLPGGRPVNDDAARVEVERVWDASVPTTAGRDLAAILELAVDEENPLGGLLIGGVELADLPDAQAAEAALASAGFVVSLELRRSAITEYADVVLPVAATAEKAGRFVTWEGRRRPFDLTLTNSGQMADGRVLNSLADELDVNLGLPSHEAARAELDALGVTTTRVAFGHHSATGAPDGQNRAGGAVLATWHELIDGGRGSDGDDNLAGTAKPARVVLSKQTAADLGIADGQQVTVSTAHGELTVPAVISEAADGVVWLPTNHRDASVRATLGAAHGDLVTVTGGTQ